MAENVNKLKDKDIQDLTNSLYLINGLYVQMASERDHLTDTASKMVNATKQFQAYLEKFKDQKDRIPVLIHDTLAVEAENIAKNIVDRTYEQIISQTNQTLNNLNNAINRANEKLLGYGRKERLFSKGFLAFMFIAAIMGGLSSGGLIRYYYPAPDKYPAIDKQTRIKIQNGEWLESAWAKLDKEGQKKLMALLNKAK